VGTHDSHKQVAAVERRKAKPLDVEDLHTTVALMPGSHHRKAEERRSAPRRLLLKGVQIVWLASVAANCVISISKRARSSAAFVSGAAYPLTCMSAVISPILSFICSRRSAVV
jgi:hypothetical protein